MTWIHIIAGLVAILAGAMAMIAAKGSPLHRKAGNLFTISMLIMTGSAAIVSFFLRTDHVTGVVALVTAYLVVTSWLVVKRKVEDSARLLAGLAVAAALVGLYSLSLWFNFVEDPKTLITRNSRHRRWCSSAWSVCCARRWMCDCYGPAKSQEPSVWCGICGGCVLRC